MSRSINPISLFKTGTEPFPSSPRSHRLDESATSYSLTGCSPALPVSASPADLYIHAVQAICQRRLGKSEQFFSGLELLTKANYQHPGWAKSEYRSGPG